MDDTFPFNKWSPGHAGSGLPLDPATFLSEEEKEKAAEDRVLPKGANVPPPDHIDMPDG